MPKLRFGKFKTVYKGKIFTIKHRPVQYEDGSKDYFEYCRRPDSVVVLAFNQKNELLMIKEYRHRHKEKEVWFLPAGRIDQRGDNPKKAAQRELREEAGYRAKKLKLFRKSFPSNTSIFEVYVFAAKDLVYAPLPGDKGEYIKVKFVPFRKAMQMATDGTIKNEFIAYNIIRFDYLLKHGRFQW